MNPLSTKGDLLRYLDHCACEYHVGATASIARNKHMNKMEGQLIPQDIVNAVLVDFINWVGTHQGLDYALYTRDLKGDHP